MPVTNTPIFPQKPTNGKLQLLHANAAGTFVTIYTGGANGSKITGLIAQSTDSAAHDLQIAIVRSGTTYILGTVNVPLGAGNTGSVPSVNLLNNVQLPGLPLDSDGNPFIFLLDANDTLAINPVVIVTNPTQVNITAIGSDF